MPDPPTESTPLASLTPSVPPDSHITALVTLIWPYSAATRTLSIVASEPNPLLRLSKGQLRVKFSGAAAAAVEKTGLQSGDTVDIGLGGARWEELTDVGQRDVPWVMGFGETLEMKIKSTESDTWRNISVDPASSPSPSAAPSENPHSPSTLQPTSPPPQHEPNNGEWSNPSLLKRRLPSPDSSSASTLFAIGETDLFDDDDGHRSKRARFSSSFRFEEEVDSDGGALEEALANGLASGDENSTSVGNRFAVDMPPPPPPPQLALNTRFDDVGETPDSPDLRPVPSECLSIVSPFLGRGLAGEMDFGMAAATVAAVDVSQSLTLRSEATPEVVVIPAEGEGIRPPTQSPTKPRPRARTPGPSEAQKLADQQLEDRQPSDYESEKDSLFDEFSDNELRRRTKKTLGRSPLKSVESLRPPRRTPQRSKLTLETNINDEGEHKEGGQEHKAPFLYLPTPSPKTEKGAVVKSASGLGKEYESVLGLGFGGDGAEDGSPTRRRSSFWGMREETIPDEIDAFFGGGGIGGRESASGTEEGYSGFSTPLDGEEEEDEVGDDPTAEQQQSEEEEEEEQSFGEELGFRSGVTTNLSDFPPLSALTWGAVVDMIAVVTRSWPAARSKRGQKDYYTSMRIVDSSFPGGMTATVLRPHIEALPAVVVGDVVLLRSFKITSFKRNFVATSTPNSAWAVWRADGHGRDRPVITGPPVEYGEGEEAYVEAIAAWFEGLDAEVREGMVRSSAGGELDLEFDF